MRARRSHSQAFTGIMYHVASYTSRFRVLYPSVWGFYSVAVITSGSDRHHFSDVGHPGDPGSIPGRTFPFALPPLATAILAIVPLDGQPRTYSSFCHDSFGLPLLGRQCDLKLQEVNTFAFTPPLARCYRRLDTQAIRRRRALLRAESNARQRKPGSEIHDYSACA